MSDTPLSPAAEAADPGTEPGKAPTSRVLQTVLLTVFIDMLGVGILIPVVPQLLGNPRSPEYLLPSGWTYKQGLILLGFLIASYSFAQFIATPILGQLSDRHGRKPILAISLAGTSISYVAFAIGVVTKNIPLLFASRIFDGATGGNIAVAQAAVADISTPENRTKNFGLVGATFGMGFILGPYIGGKLATPDTTVLSIGGHHFLTTPSWFGAATPFWFAAILAGLNAFMVVTRFPETLTKLRKQGAIAWNQSVLNIRKAITIPGVKSIFPAVFMYQAGFTFFTTFFSLYLVQKLGFKASNIGDFFAYIGLWIAFTQGALAGPLAKRFPDWKIIRVGLVGLVFGLLAVFIPNSTAQLLLIAPIIPLFVGSVMANLTSLVSRTAPRHMQGEILGINASVMALAQAIPAALTGFLGGISKEVPIIAAAACVAIAALMFWTMYRPPAGEPIEAGMAAPVAGH